LHAAKKAALAGFIAECHHARHQRRPRSIPGEKKGFDTGIRVIHPFAPNWTLPVYVANFVLMDYGTGAIFGCPAHDQRDLDFVNKYGLGNIPVVMSAGRRPEDLRVTDDRL
jgi:leucyl-tRNA synthetase